MKTFKALLCCKTLLLILLSFSVFNGVAQITGATHVTFGLKNCAQFDARTFEFDLALVNDGTNTSTTMQVSACTFGIKYNPGIVNGGTLTFSVVPGTTQTSSSQSVIITSIPASNYMKATLSPVLANVAGQAAVLQWGTELRICRVRVTNTVDFPAGISTSFVFQGTTQPGGLTRTVGGFWINLAQGSGGTGNITTINESPAPTGNGNNQALGNIACNLTLYPCLAATATELNGVTCCTCNDGSASVNLAGLAIPSSGTYTVDGGAGQTFSSNPFTVTGLSRGNHIIVVTGGTCSSTTTVNIGPNTATLTATETHTALGCSEDSSTVTIAATGGVPGYNGTGIFRQAAGTTHTYIVTDQLGCSTQIEVSIPARATTPLAVTETHTPVGCWGGSIVTISATGGVPPYDGTGSFFQDSSSTHTYFVTDANECTASVIATIPGGPVASLTITHTETPIRCYGDSSLVTITITGAVGDIVGIEVPLECTFISNPSNGTYIYKQAANVGAVYNYFDLLTDCYATAVIITPPALPQLVVSETHNPLGCSGDSSTVFIYATGGLPGYTGTGTFRQAAGTTHNYIVTDQKGCSTPVTAIIPTRDTTPLVVTETHGSVNCFGFSWVTITATGGTEPYTGTGDFQQDSSSTHTYYVTDANGCISSVSVAISNGPIPFIHVSVTQTPITCFGDSSYVTAIISGGMTDTIRYSQPSGIEVEFLVMDWNTGCSGYVHSFAFAPPQLIVTATPLATSYCGGAIPVNVTASGGTAPYTSGIGTFNQTSGTVTYTVTDANGCSGSTDLTLTTLTQDTIAPFITHCPGSVSGVTDGYGNAILPDLSDSVTAIDNCTPENALIRTQSPPAGTVVGTGNTNIVVTITDAANNSTTCSFNISYALPKPVVTETHTTLGCSEDSSTVTVSATGGLPGYTGTGIFRQAAGTTHSYSVTDQNGSSSQVDVSIPPRATAPLLVTERHRGQGCYGSAAIISASGGVGPYTGTGYFPQDTSTTHTYFVTDANGCTASVTVTIPGGTYPDFTITHTQTPITCFTDSCTLTVTLTGGTGNFRAIMDDPRHLVSGPVNGTYIYKFPAMLAPLYTAYGDFEYVDLTSGCYHSFRLNIHGFPAQLKATATQLAPLYCGSSVPVTVTATGGTAPYTSGTGTFNQSAGTVTYTVTDVNGCSASTDLTITAVADTEAPNIIGCVSPQSLTSGSDGLSLMPDLTTAVLATDNCTPTNQLVITQTPAAGTPISIGNLPVTITVTDASNNQSTCSSGVTVQRCVLTIADTIAGPKNACAFMGVSGGTATYSIAATNALSYVWTVPAGAIGLTGQGTNTISFKYPSNYTGTGTVSVTVSNNCGSTPVTRTLAVSTSSPLMPAAINGPANACAYIGTNTVLTYSIDPVSNATGYLWTVTPGSITIVSGQGTTQLLVKFISNAVASIKVRALSGCANSSDKVLNISRTAFVPASISGPTNACIYLGSANNTATDATYSINKIPNIDHYNWTVPAGATITTHPGGAGTANDTIITVAFTNAFVANSTIGVSASSVCGTSTIKTLAIRRTMAAMPGTIAGQTNACPLMISPANPAGTPTRYAISKALNATGYIWTMPAGATYIKDNASALAENDTAVIVIFDASFIGGAANPISVRSVNGCGSSNPRTLTISKLLPSMPGMITGPTDPCPITGTPTRYWIRKSANATGYSWMVPAGASFTHENAAGPTDTAIFITWTSAYTTGNLTVQATNNCAVSTIRTFIITGKLPAMPGAIITSAPTACPGRLYTYAVAAMPANAGSLLWTLPAAASMVSQSALSITVQYTDAAISDTIRVQSVNGCTNSAQRKLKVSLPACPPTFAGRGTTTISTETTTSPAKAFQTKMEVKLFPNPTVRDFNLQVTSPAKELIQVRILDITGKELQHTQIMPSETIRLGSELKAGTYLIEIKQGENSRVEKIVKF